MSLNKIEDSGNTSAIAGLLSSEFLSVLCSSPTENILEIGGSILSVESPISTRFPVISIRREELLLDKGDVRELLVGVCSCLTSMDGNCARS